MLKKIIRAACYAEVMLMLVCCGITELAGQVSGCYVVRDMSVEGLAREADFHSDYIEAVERGTIDMTAVYTIPVVVHQVRSLSGTVISDQVLSDMMYYLNLGFAGINGATDTRIRFVLANRDPKGRCTNGLDQIITATPAYDCSGSGGGESVISNNIWDRHRYFNIFVFESFQNCGGFAMLTSQTKSKGEALTGYMIAPYFEFTYDISNNNSVGTKGGSVIHEACHYLGGHHLDGEGNETQECHDPSECLIKGDWVCDTKLHSPNVTGTVVCEYTNHCPDGSTNPLDADNFMCRFGSCEYRFTPGQAALMRYSIEWAGQHLVSAANLNEVAPVETAFYGPAPGGDKLITAPTVLSDPNYKTDGNIVIKNGGSLTISAGTTLRMGSGYKIVIEPGGWLRLEGRIRDLCGEPWAGIEVQGEQLVSGVLKSGYFYNITGAVIEHAQTGLKLYGPLVSDVGGRANCTGLTVRNCKTGVDIQPYPAHITRTHTANFDLCSFVTDKNYLFTDPDFVHINMRSVRGVNIYGCSFTNTKAVAGANSVTQFGYGIRAIDGGFTLDKKCNSAIAYPYTGCSSFVRSTFSGLGYGIYVGKDRGCNPYMILSAEFEKCYYGAHLVNTSFGTVLFNAFTMGSVPSTANGLNTLQVGVLFESQTLNSVFEENIFRKTTGNVYDTYGTVAQHMDVQDRTFRRNSYDGLTFANIANGVNASERGSDGLVYNCNTNYGNTHGDFLMPAPGDIVSQEQGLADGNQEFKAAGNTFSHANALNYSDFHNNGTASNDPDDWRNYYYLNVVPQNPQYFLKINKSDGENNTCVQKYCEGPCLTSNKVPDIMFLNGGSALSTLKSAYNYTWTTYQDILARTPNPPSAEQRYYEALLTDQAGDVMRYMLNDTLHNYLDSVATWGLKLNTPAGDWYAADVYRNLGQGATATSVINAIGTRYIGLIDASMYNAQKTLFGLISSAQSGLTSASSLASYTTGSGPVRSLAAAFQVSRGEYHDPYFWVGGPAFRSAEEPAPADTEPKLTVYPNPSTGIVTVDAGTTAISGLLIVYNALGEAVAGKLFTGKEQDIQLDLSGKPSGQYYVTIRQNDGKTIIGSFILVR